MSDEIEMSPLQAKAYAAAYQRFAAQLQAEQKITIRQQAVLMAMQGLLAAGRAGYDESDIANLACRYADAVLKREAETR